MKLSSKLVFALSMFFVALAWYSTKRGVELYDEQRFSAVADNAHLTISARMQTYLNALIQTKSMFGVTRAVDRAEFRQYVENLNLLKEYPGIQGLGYTVRVPARELSKHLASVRKGGFPEYRVWPEHPRDEYFSIIYLEPFDWRNQRAFGYDMYSEPTRRAAMAAARDTGLPAATRVVKLVQETDEGTQPGFLIYVPVYKNGHPIATVEQRRAALEGFVYSPFRVHDLFKGIFGETPQSNLAFDFEVYDGNEVAPEHALYAHDRSLDAVKSDFKPGYKVQRVLDVAGKPWTIVVYSLPSFHSKAVGIMPTLILLVGFLLSALLARTMRATQKEIETNLKTRLLLESMSEGVSISDESGLITYTNPAEDRMFGYEPGELIGKHVSVQNTYPVDENARIVTEVIRQLNEKGLWSGEFSNIRKDGTHFTTFARITVLDYAGKKHFVCIQQDVTEQRRAQREREEFEARFRAMFEQSPFSTQILSPDGGTVQVNEAFKKLWGLSGDAREAHFLKEYNILKDPQIKARGILPYIQKAFSGEATAIPPSFYDPKDFDKEGRPRWVQAFIYPVKAESGELREVILVHDDITDRIEAEEARDKGRRQLERLRTHNEMILNSAGEGIYGLDNEGRTTFINPAAAKMLGWSPEELIGKSQHDMIHHSNPDGSLFPKDKCPIYKSFKDGVEHTVDTEVFWRKDKSSFPVEYVSTPIREGGAIVGAVVTFRDIEKRKRDDAKRQLLSEISDVLSQSLDYEDTLAKVAANLVPQLGDFCIVDTLEGERIRRVVALHANVEKQRLLDELRVKYPPSWDSPQPAARAIRSGEPELLRHVNVPEMKDHSRGPEHLKLIQSLGITSHLAVPLLVRDRKLGAISLGITESAFRYDAEDLAFVQEVARRASIAIENALLYKQAHDAIRARDEFLSIASHELKTPLTSLKLQLQLTKRQIQLDEGGSPSPQMLAKVINVSNRQVDRLAGLVEDLLDVSRMQTGKLALHPESVDLSELVNEAIDAHAAGLSEAGCALELKLDPDVVGHWDRGRVEQVITNLIINATKYAPGAPVRIETHKQGGSAILVVQDFGPGIREDKQANIFERFERAISSRNISGLGLGLFIVRTLVEAHGGTVSLESQVGKGSKFMVRLPLTA